MSRMRQSVMLAGALFLLAGTAATATASDIMEVKVPFPFVVNREVFPAGQYMVERDDTASSVLLIRGEKANHSAGFVTTRPASGQQPDGATPTLTFTRHENQYRLSSVWESSRAGWSVIGR